MKVGRVSVRKEMEVLSFTGADGAGDAVDWPSSVSPAPEPSEEAAETEVRKTVLVSVVVVTLVIVDVKASVTISFLRQLVLETAELHTVLPFRIIGQASPKVQVSSGTMVVTVETSDAVNAEAWLNWNPAEYQVVDMLKTVTVGVTQVEVELTGVIPAVTFK